MTPWAPIAITLLATLGSALVVWRVAHNVALATATALLVLALASFALGTIATIAFFWGGLLLIGALAGFLVAWLRRAGRKLSTTPDGHRHKRRSPDTRS